MTTIFQIDGTEFELTFDIEEIDTRIDEHTFINEVIASLFKFHDDDDAKEIMDKFPTKKFNKQIHKNNSCVICTQKYVKNDIILTLPCMHYFHENCIRKWIQNFHKKTCPHCRHNIYTVE